MVPRDTSNPPKIVDLVAGQTTKDMSDATLGRNAAFLLTGSSFWFQLVPSEQIYMANPPMSRLRHRSSSSDKFTVPSKIYTVLFLYRRVRAGFSFSLWVTVSCPSSL